MVQLPKSSKLPSPSAEAPNAKSGKQHGEKIAVRSSPAVPSLSMLLVNFIFVFLLAMGCSAMRLGPLAKVELFNLNSLDFPLQPTRLRQRHDDLLIMQDILKSKGAVLSIL